MTKKKKNQYMNDFIVNNDELCYLPDEDLRNMQDMIRKDRDMAARDGYDTRSAEINLCYVQREMSVRDARRAAHFAYLNAHGLVDQEAQPAETQLDSEASHTLH